MYLQVMYTALDYSWVIHRTSLGIAEHLVPGLQLSGDEWRARAELGIMHLASGTCAHQQLVAVDGVRCLDEAQSSFHSRCSARASLRLASVYRHCKRCSSQLPRLAADPAASGEVGLI
jgi:hypothetical protein